MDEKRHDVVKVGINDQGHGKDGREIKRTVRKDAQRVDGNIEYAELSQDTA